MEIEIGKIYKVKGEANVTIYVEIEEAPEWATLKENQVYICTRTPYATSMFGQIETAGIIDKSELKPLSNKEDKEALKRIVEVQNRQRRFAMQFYARETPDGLIHVQNAIMGKNGQHHAHDKDSFERWQKGIDKENIHFEKTESCDCELKSGDVKEYDGKVWHNDKFESD